VATNAHDSLTFLFKKTIHKRHFTIYIIQTTEQDTKALWLPSICSQNIINQNEVQSHSIFWYENKLALKNINNLQRRLHGQSDQSNTTTPSWELSSWKHLGFHGLLMSLSEVLWIKSWCPYSVFLQSKSHWCFCLRRTSGVVTDWRTPQVKHSSPKGPPFPTAGDSPSQFC